jgi:hypothetical protein
VLPVSANPLPRVLPYPGPIKVGSRGPAQLAVKRALWRAGYWKPPKGGFSRVFGPFAWRVLKRFQADHERIPNGVYTRWTHQNLAKHFDDYGAYLLAQAVISPGQKKRSKVAAAGLLAYQKRDQMLYTQGGMRMHWLREKIRPPRVPRWSDCSSFATWLYWQAGATDPNGRGYDGYGYTGTLAQNGRRIFLSDSRPGDLVFYGRFPHTHVTVVVSNKQGRVRCVSMGSSAGPYLVDARYRGDLNQVRSYL